MTATSTVNVGYGIEKLLSVYKDYGRLGRGEIWRERR
jgi:hypothetical protein